jgi:hypothetical protein
MKQIKNKKLTLSKQTISNMQRYKGGIVLNEQHDILTLGLDCGNNTDLICGDTVAFGCVSIGFDCGTGCVCPTGPSCGIACTAFDCYPPVEL